MSSRYVYQLQPFRFTDVVGPNVSILNKNIRIDFPVDEVRITKFNVVENNNNGSVFPLLGMILSTDITGSMQEVASTTSLINTQTAVAPGNNFTNTTEDNVTTRFIFPRNSQRTYNGSFQFKIACADGSVPLGGKIVTVQMEFIQYDPVPEWQRFKEFMSFVANQSMPTSARLDLHDKGIIEAPKRRR